MKTGESVESTGKIGVFQVTGIFVRKYQNADKEDEIMSLSCKWINFALVNEFQIKTVQTTPRVINNICGYL